MFSDSLGVPPATVTASLIFTVSVTTWPAFKFPLPLPSMPGPEIITDATAGAVASICNAPAGLGAAPEGTIQLAADVERDKAAVLSANSLLVSGPMVVTSTNLVGDGPGVICGYAEDRTTVAGTGCVLKSMFASAAEDLLESGSTLLASTLLA